MKILVSALETSSNIHLKELLKELPSDIKLSGIFDKKLGTPNYDITELAVMGFIDVIKKLPFFLKLKKEMVLLSKDCDKVLLMDSSGFNLPLAKAIKKEFPQKEIIYYILPQAWAWKRKRVYAIEKYCDKLCSIIPFEREVYPNPSRVEYVGHPLLDEIKYFKSDITKNNKLAYMPGSRRGEISKLMPIFRELSLKFPEHEHILVIPPTFSEEKIKNFYGDISNFKISKEAHKILSEVEFAFICSGTATLEAAIIGTPFVLSYIAKPVDFFIGRKIFKIMFVGLANIFFIKMGKKPIHIELLQEDVSLENLIKEYKEVDSLKFLENSKILREYLKYGSSKNVASIILK